MNPIHIIKACYRKVDRWYKLGYNTIFYSCEHVSKLTSEMHDRPLGWRERFTYWIHLRMCTWCRRYAKQLQCLRRHFGQYAKAYPEESKTKIPEDAKSRILKKVSDSSSDSL